MAANSADGGGERTLKSRTFLGGMELDTISIYSRSSKPRRVRQPLVGVARGWAGHRVMCCMETRDRWR